MTPQLRPYQEEALAQIVAERRLILADPIGSGKTATALSALDAVASGRALILTPSYVLDQWGLEGERWSPGTEMILGTGTATKRRRARERLREVPGPAALVLNYESAWRDVDDLMKVGFDTLICDEAHRLKNRQTSTFKGIAKLARRLPNVILITGTPILNRADELWSALHLLHPIRYPSFIRWSDEHFAVEAAYFNGPFARPVRVVGDLRKGHAELLRKELGRSFLQRSLDEIRLQLPPLVENTITVQLSAAERQAYDELERRSWTRVDGELVQVENEVAKITRLRQLGSEWSVLGARGTHHGSKVAATVELVKDLEPEQVLVVAQYKATVEALAEELNAPFVHGDVHPLARQDRLNAFMAGTAPILVATQATVGEGVDGLQCAHHLVMVDRDWTPARNEQTIGRLRRSGQEHDTVFVHYIVADNTLDKTMADALSSKTQVIASVLEGTQS